MKKILFSCIFSFSLLFADLVNAVAVSVDDEAITLYDIVKVKDRFGFTENQAVDYLIDIILKKQEVQKLGIEVSQYEVEQELNSISKSNGMNVDDFKKFLVSKGISWDEHKKDIEDKISTRKLFKKIAYSKIKFPNDSDLNSYYNSHINEFKIFNTINVVEYSSNSEDSLVKLVQNPMFRSNDITRNEYNLESKQISPKLMTVLVKTNNNEFTKILKVSDNKYSVFYVKNKSNSAPIQFDLVKNRILEIMLKEQEAKIVKNYFDDLRINADINVVR
jgi:hypothetical protein